MHVAEKPNAVSEPGCNQLSEAHAEGVEEYIMMRGLAVIENICRVRRNYRAGRENPNKEADLNVPSYF